MDLREKCPIKNLVLLQLSLLLSIVKFSRKTHGSVRAKIHGKYLIKLEMLSGYYIRGIIVRIKYLPSLLHISPIH